MNKSRRKLLTPLYKLLVIYNSEFRKEKRNSVTDGLVSMCLTLTFLTLALILINLPLSTHYPHPQ